MVLGGEVCGLSSVDFIEYVYLLKMIRGILLARSTISDDVKNWLRRAIRWRPVGVGSKTRKILGKSGFRSKTVLNLVYAFQSHKKLSSLLSECGLSEEASEALVLSSTYIVPLIILDEKSLGELISRKLVVNMVRSNMRIKDKMIKLHLRISEYSMKDNFYDLISRAANAITNNKLDAELKHRKKFCEKDTKRYWRINKGVGKPVIVYVDPLRALRDKLEDVKEMINEDKNVTLGLGICVGVVIPNMLALTQEEKID